MRNLPIMSILHFPAWPRPHCGAAALTILCDLSGLTDNVRDVVDEPPGNKPAGQGQKHHCRHDLCGAHDCAPLNPKARNLYSCRRRAFQKPRNWPVNCV